MGAHGCGSFQSWPRLASSLGKHWFSLSCLKLACTHWNFLTVSVKLSREFYSRCPRVGLPALELRVYSVSSVIILSRFFPHYLFVSVCAHTCLCVNVLVKLEDNFREWALETERRRQAWQQASFPIESSHQLCLCFSMVSIVIRALALSPFALWATFHHQSPRSHLPQLRLELRFSYLCSRSFGNCSSPVLIFKISLTIQDVVRFCMNFKILG